MKKILFATGNKTKIVEAQAILQIPIEIANIEIDEVQSMDLEYISKVKTEEAFKKLKRPVITDDVGLYIKYLNDFPGPLIKWVLGAAGGNAGLILKIMKGKKNRYAKARLAIGYHDGNKVHIFIGEVEGRISEKIRGNRDVSMGWDSVFIPKGYNKTYAQMSLDEKIKTSHRRKALDKLKEFLDSQS